MKYKHDWPEAQERLTALWRGQVKDRPCIAVTAPSGRSVPRPPSPSDPERRWLDPDWVWADALATLENTWWGGEAIPSYLLMGGWVLCLGGTPRFDHHTIWHAPMTVDFTRPSPFVHDPENPWVQKFLHLYNRMTDMAGYDDFAIGRPPILPANDLISMHLGAQQFLTALIDEPDWMRQAILTGARELLAARTQLHDAIRGRHHMWYGNAGWMPFWAPNPFEGCQSDVSCMLSPEMYETFILPELALYAGAFGALWYHLDGHDARQHLPRLLSLPYLRVLQYTPTPAEPPNGPAHLDFYRQVQAAGKIVHIQVPKQHVEPLVRALDPARLMLDTACDTPDEGRELLAAARRWMNAKG
ncbi:MAG: hypothetical protein K8T26_09520 [Lentisphaerae bacterium]|nr:hypothetical protein [Lentisphaerota bacterium]